MNILAPQTRAHDSRYVGLYHLALLIFRGRESEALAAAFDVNPRCSYQDWVNGRTALICQLVNSPSVF